jgi:uncharacterized protein
MADSTTCTDRKTSLRSILKSSRIYRIPGSDRVWFGVEGLYFITLDLVHICAYNVGCGLPMGSHKARSNLRKHNITFADAVFVFSDERALTIEDDFPDEERFITIGTDAFGRILVIIYTYRENTIRIISARKATAQERKQYEE